MDYFTIDGVTLRTGFSEILVWYLLCIRELLDNAVDFLTKNYKGAGDTVVDVTVFKDDKTFRLNVRNSNYKNIPVFASLSAVFDYDMRYGSKQDVHVIGRGMLGDALKQIRAFEYVLLHVGYEDTAGTFQDKQAKYPAVIRHNGKKCKVYLKVDKVRQTASVQVQNVATTKTEEQDKHTEIEITLPVIDEVRQSLNRQYIETFCRKYPLFTTDITFRFHTTDNSDYPVVQEEDNDGNDNAEQLAKAILTAKPSKATEHIEYQALHAISSQSWSDKNSVHSYTREEFKRRLVNIDQKQAESLSVYDVLARTYREASNLEKTDENKITVAELLSLTDKERNKKIERFYKKLRDIFPPSPKLVLPYTTNTQQRKVALYARVMELRKSVNSDASQELDPDLNKASYKSIHGFYEDKKRGTSYPYFFEILAVPFRWPQIAKKDIEFIGAINYSISPKTQGSIFEGNYEQGYRNWNEDTLAYEDEKITDILGLLEYYGFHAYATDRSKIPCVVVANLVTPRRDPHGQDKSRIDTSPFIESIAEAVRKVSSEIKTYRGVGLTFSNPKERCTAEQHSSGKKSLKSILAEYLVNEHGLSASEAAIFGYGDDGQ